MVHCNTSHWKFTMHEFLDAKPICKNKFYVYANENPVSNLLFWKFTPKFLKSELAGQQRHTQESAAKHNELFSKKSRLDKKLLYCLKFSLITLKIPK